MVCFFGAGGAFIQHEAGIRPGVSSSSSSSSRRKKKKRKSKAKRKKSSSSSSGSSSISAKPAERGSQPSQAESIKAPKAEGIKVSTEVMVIDSEDEAPRD